jgi:hypothetical protein
MESQMFQVNGDQLVRMGLIRFSKRLSSFIQQFVQTPKPFSYEQVQQAVFTLYPNAHQAGFDSEVDMALYVIARFCFPNRANELDTFVANKTISVNERRYRLNADLAQLGFMEFGALEADEPGTEY